MMYGIGMPYISIVGQYSRTSKLQLHVLLTTSVVHGYKAGKEKLITRKKLKDKKVKIHEFM